MSMLSCGNKLCKLRCIIYKGREIRLASMYWCCWFGFRNAIQPMKKNCFTPLRSNWSTWKT